jgi:hypothetical protein
MLARRTLFPALIAAVFVLGLAGQAEAGRKWCKRDPVFLVAGTLVSVEVAVPWDDQNRVTGPVDVTLYVPKGTKASLVSTDEGFGGQGEVASVAVSDRLRKTAKGVQILVAVTVPASSRSVVVNVLVTPDQGRTASGNGRANAKVSVNSVVVPTP